MANEIFIPFLVKRQAHPSEISLTWHPEPTQNSEQKILKFSLIHDLKKLKEIIISYFTRIENQKIFSIKLSHKFLEDSCLHTNFESNKIKFTQALFKMMDLYII